MPRPMRLLELWFPAQKRPPPALTPVLRHISEVDIDRAYHWGRHRHESYEAIAVRRGRYRCRLNDVELELRPGQALLVKPGDWHEDILTGPLRYTALWFALAGEVALFAPECRAVAQVARIDAGARAALDRLRAAIDEDTIAGAGLRQALFGEFLWSAVRGLPDEGLDGRFRSGGEDAAFAQRLGRVLDRHLDQPTSVAAIARELSLSPAVLTHRCRAALGVSPARALRHRRLDHARALLEHSGLAIKAVAARLGFADQFQFSKAFKKRHGFAPSRLR